MRPFKFFFLASIGIIILFNVAKMVLMALFIASIMSLVYFGVKTLIELFSGKSTFDVDYRHRLEDNDYGFNYLEEHPMVRRNNPVYAPWEHEKLIIIK